MTKEDCKDCEFYDNGICTNDLHDCKIEDVVYTCCGLPSGCPYKAKKRVLTNKEFQELLKQYPDDTVISIEYCKPREMVYDDKSNLLKID